MTSILAHYNDDQSLVDCHACDQGAIFRSHSQGPVPTRLPQRFPPTRSRKPCTGPKRSSTAGEQPAVLRSIDFAGRDAADNSPQSLTRQRARPSTRQPANRLAALRPDDAPARPDLLPAPAYHSPNRRRSSMASTSPPATARAHPGTTPARTEHRVSAADDSTILFKFYRLGWLPSGLHPASILPFPATLIRQDGNNNSRWSYIRNFGGSVRY